MVEHWFKNGSHNHRGHDNVHHTLAHSYSYYLFVGLFGVFLDLIFPLNLLDTLSAEIVGFSFIFLATILIFWAQHTSRKLHIGEITKESFSKGPYKYTRTPTHLGLFFLLVGLGFVLNTFFLIVFSVLSYAFTRLTYVKKQENILIKKYGEPYKEYQKMVWF